MRPPKAWRFLLACLPLALSGCEYVPEGATLYKVAGKREYDQAYIHFPPGEGQLRQPVKLRWADTNTWLTTLTLESGNYRFAARTVDGSASYSHTFTPKPGERIYEFPEHTAKESAESAAASKLRGPQITCQVSVSGQAVPLSRVAVVFYGKDVTVYRESLLRGRLATAAPVAGRFRVMISSIGVEPPLVWMSDVVDISGPRDLGEVTLK